MAASDAVRRKAGRGRFMLMGVLALAVVALPLAWYLISPLFIDQRVDEDFPIAAAPIGTSVPAAAARATETPAPTPTMLPTATVAPATTPAPTAIAGSAAPVTSQAAPTPMPPTAPPPTATPTPAPAPTPAGPAVLGSGQFTTVDSIHKGVGTATIYLLPDGRRILRFEGFTVTNGPDLFVYLSGHAEPRSSGELHAVADYEIARLKGNVGDQNYELPADLDLAQFRSIVIYCKRFTTVFSTATLGTGR